ncbi:cell division regulator GpsB [Alkalicoccus halolimnae]|jgi:DivIVA domain-containing protein|uniref:Cell division regulator GpsB n=1 Tax=Alkalicoccus halolimnae TaxID=1667239 RepID=A0A5C7F9C3_9BACI|nr:cell division regulator GpsB [Alkalicoccus halolimnae]TXF87262.1 cell division regulator GpsB [Alkalicoccus halolimnae]
MERISKLTKNDIYEREFKASMRGYNQDEVDQFLDEIIKDYEAFENQIQKLEKQIEDLKENRPVREGAKPMPKPHQAGNTNYDILRRLSNLEKHVFGSRLNE